MSEGEVLMAKLEALIQRAANASTFIGLVRDPRPFIQYHKWAIENTPLQAYTSTLVFSPNCSMIKNLFKEEAPKWITIKPAMIDKWGACLQTLEDHSDSVTAIAFSLHDQPVASASDHNTIRLWDAGTGSCRSTLEGHSSVVYAVAFSPDSWLVASVSDKTVQLWGVATVAGSWTLEGHSDGVTAVIFSPSDQKLATSSFDGTVRLWDTVTGAALEVFESPKNSFSSTRNIAFSLAGKLLVSISCVETASVWHPITGAVVQMLDSYGGRDYAAAFSPDCKLLATASDSKLVRLWDMTTEASLQTIDVYLCENAVVAF